MPDPVWPHRTIIQIALIGTCQGNAIVNVHHWQVGTAREATLISDDLAYDACEELADDWLTHCKASWYACHTTDYTLSLVRAQVVERPGNWRHRLTPAEVSPGSGNQGTQAVPAEDFHTAGVIRWRTNRAGKSYRGRTYVGPLTPPWEADGRLSSAGQTAIAAYATAVKGQWAVGGADYNDFGLTIYSRPYNHQEYGYVRGSGPSREFYFPPEYAGDATNVQTSAIDPILRVQRRREVGVGA